MVSDSPRAAGSDEGSRPERLPELHEPVELREELRRDALSDRGGSGTAQGFEVTFGAWLWERWKDRLEPAGFDSALILEVVTGYRREVWFWLLGDRRWDQLVEGLAGRVTRRAPAT